MYKLMVGELGREKRNCSGGIKKSAAGWTGKPLAVETCRISALSSADYCLHDRVDMDWGKIVWKGSPQEIRRLFAAERLDARGLEQLEGQKEYAVLFLGRCGADCA